MVAVHLQPTCVCYNELFVTAHVDDILNTDSNNEYSVTVIYNIPIFTNIYFCMRDRKVK